jgi:chromosome segregation ATPase
MQTSRLIIMTIICALSFSSCVLKKKFVEMESSKLRAEERVRELTSENEAQANRIEEMIAEYEKMKQELLGSNAQKDEMIGKLSGQINLLNSNVKEKDATIEEKLYAFEYEKRRTAEELEISKNAQTSLQNKNTSLAQELSATKNELAELRFNQQRQNDDAKRVDEQIRLKDQKFDEQSAVLLKLQEETDKLKAQIREKDQIIERLTNNVNLLKKELSK